MKRIIKALYIVLIVIIMLSGFFIYNVFENNKLDEDEKNKVLSGIKQLDNRFTSLFNDLNNINFESYKISESEIKNKSSDKQNSSQDEAESGSSKSSSEKSGDSSNSESSSNVENQNSTSQEQDKKYDMEINGILTGTLDPDWNKIKNDVENMYTFLYSNFIDLYKNERNQEAIINFNKEYDNLTKYVKEENKAKSLAELSIIYSYLPKFIENYSDSQKEIIVIRTKSYIFNAYSILETEEWNKISENISNASNEFTKLVTNINNNENLNQYNINKIYIMINELQNSVVMKDKDIFLIKYKNLLEELQNI